ncbi:MAG TPA: maltose alpha-D-glucosyltransferase [Thermoanaerobaculia bacterium]|nr:maltose alpha-D-glucosyltransferase [Thermoanaerobaculia bacterium]
MADRKPRRGEGEREALWYKDAVIYQIHVRAFADADGDGIGDFAGLTEKLDYLASLGVTALWLQPFYPSPLRDDGYDIADYDQVNPAYGELADFKRFLKEAHRRGLKVITELVINHTSDQHAWFQRARRAAPGSTERNFYVWSDDPDRYREARIIFKDFESSNWSWDPVADAYFWHRFYHHQPDLNFDEPAVHQAVFDAMDFWFGFGVDGMRLDAIPYLYEREGTNCENLPETHAFLKKLRRRLDRSFDHRMLLAEANQWPEDAVAYFGDGDECHMCFHFPVMPRLFMAVRQEDRFPIIDILEQTPAIPETAQWATFLRNHDELTLEMVTDEDRDYMYRSYAADRRARINLGIRRRLAPLMGNDRRRMELMNALLFSLPGTPVLYYGDEIGMGDNIYLGDRNGVRTPMQWSSDRNAGFSRANPQKLFLPVIIDPEYHYEAVNVEAQQSNPHSLLWWTRRLIALRKRYRAFSRGTIDFLYPANPKVLAFVRRFEDERVLVVANLSRFVQHVELDMRGADPEFVGTFPMELFGRTPFPPIGDWPYLLTLGPHGFYWFSLERERLELSARPGRGGEARDGDVPAIEWAGDWHDLFTGQGRGRLDAALERLLAPRRWFGGKARTVRNAAVADALAIADPAAGLDAVFATAEVEYVDGEPERYALFVACAEGDLADLLLHDQPWSIYARLEGGGRGEGGGGRRAKVLYDALVQPAAARALLTAIARRRGFKGGGGELSGHITAAFGRAGGARGELPPRLSKAEQSNTSLIFGDRFILKLFRKLEPGVNPDLEVGRFLTERAGFPHTPEVAGWLELLRGGQGQRRKAEPLTVGILQTFVQNEGDAWSYTLDSLGRFFERVLTRREQAAVPPAPEPADGLVPAALFVASLPRGGEAPAPHEAGERDRELPPGYEPELIGGYVDSARLLGERTAELHLALAGDAGDPDFAPEPFGTLYQRSLYQSMRTLTGRALQLLSERRGRLGGQAGELAETLLDRRAEVLERFGALLERRLAAERVRIHGDYHLGQVLYTGRDFLIIDFEGEPARALGERRIKRSPLVDLAGMLRSFDYASHSELARQIDGALVSADDAPALAGWGRWWRHWVSAHFLAAYLGRLGWAGLAGAGGGGEAAGGARLVPNDPADLALLLEVFLLEKAIYELRYELNNRPDWVAIPLAGILDLLGGAG